MIATQWLQDLQHGLQCHQPACGTRHPHLDHLADRLRTSTSYCLSEPHNTRASSSDSGPFLMLAYIPHMSYVCGDDGHSASLEVHMLVTYLRKVTPSLAIPQPAVISKDIADAFFCQICGQNVAIDKDWKFRVGTMLIWFCPVYLCRAI